jgi:hypothetical protein
VKSLLLEYLRKKGSPHQTLKVLIASLISLVSMVAEPLKINTYLDSPKTFTVSTRPGLHETRSPRDPVSSLFFRGSQNWLDRVGLLSIEEVLL